MMQLVAGGIFNIVKVSFGPVHTPLVNSRS